jgi:plasmid stabilization system protein ParE
MKRKSIRIQSQAQEEINQAFDWYFLRNPEAASTFLSEIGASLARIASHPNSIPSKQRTPEDACWRSFPIP